MSREASPSTSASNIAAALRAAIQDGTYRPGDRLPGENALMADYGVARMTARHALAMLRDEGLTTTRHGVGVFVREFKPIIRNSIQRVSPRQWRAGRSIWDTDDDGRTLTVDRLQVRSTATPPDEVRAILRLTEEQQVTVRDRRYNLEGKPVMLATSYLPAHLVANSLITQPNPGPGGIYARLADLGQTPACFREDVIARMPSPAEADALQIAPGTPVFLIIRTAATQDGNPIEVNRMILNAATFVIRYDFDVEL